MDVDWGNAPDWVQALGATGALLFIGFQYKRERKVERRSRHEAERLRLHAESAHARSISVEHHSEGGAGVKIVDWIFTVHNESDRAIRNVRILVQGPDGEVVSPAGTKKLENGMTVGPAMFRRASALSKR
ncbi:hypothetical protein [Actinoplanes sp. M2I2]|uniref:hypothetical protein n=1 Tax=Actinoplanes sp. M2I2 TaxID=1734444 RepID=UPI00202225B0|nr:hypothetical protein [Actinoplanes sp. M2I2]